MISDMSINIRPLLFGYLTFKNFIEVRRVLFDVDFIVNKLRKKGIAVEYKSPEEVEVLLNYWKHENYLEATNDSHIYRIDKNVLNEDFVTNKLFDRRSVNIDIIVTTYKEVLLIEYKNFP